MDTLSEREAQYWLGYERTKAKEPVSCDHAKDGKQKTFQPFPYTRLGHYTAKIQETA